MKNNSKGLLSILAIVVASVLLAGCGGDSTESPRNYGAKAGEDGAKQFKASNPGLIASEESAAQYCATMAEEGGKSNNWTVDEVFQAADSCSIWFATEMYRK